MDRCDLNGRNPPPSPRELTRAQSDGPECRKAGPSIFIAANGDRLNSTYSGIGTPPDANGVIRFSGTLTFAGGTGRFAQATGSATVQGTANVITGTGRFSFSGTISRR